MATGFYFKFNKIYAMFAADVNVINSYLQVHLLSHDNSST